MIIALSFRYFNINAIYAVLGLPCSLPPMYMSTGINDEAAAVLNGSSLLWGSVYRRKYQEESTNVSMVSRSLVAGPPHL
jgi:hypothetical protein